MLTPLALAPARAVRTALMGLARAAGLLGFAALTTAVYGSPLPTSFAAKAAAVEISTTSETFDAAAGAALDQAVLDAHCLAQIARFKRPKLYFSVSELPKNNYGKVLKTELRDMLRSEENA